MAIRTITRPRITSSELMRPVLEEVVPSGATALTEGSACIDSLQIDLFESSSIASYCVRFLHDNTQYVAACSMTRTVISEPASLSRCYESSPQRAPERSQAAAASIHRSDQRPSRRSPTPG